ncbi:MAG: hypothetical protein KJN72_11325, partial [Woeseia sp.]|nr:hypothetical protein [Woeseia sp.]
MNSKFGTRLTARLLPALAMGIFSLGAMSPASAETVKTVNGTAIDSSVLNFYIQSRTNRPAAEAT